MTATTQKKAKSKVVSAPAPRMVRSDNLVGQSAIARRFNISSQAAWNWTQRSDFPEPLPGTDCGRPVWDWEEIEEWEKNWVRSKGGWHTHQAHRGSSVNGKGPQRQWMEGDDE